MFLRTLVEILFASLHPGIFTCRAVLHSSACLIHNNKRHMKRALLASFLTLMSGAACADVDYQLRISDAAHHLAEVSATFPAATGTTLDVQMPIWRTGRYEVLNLANGVRRFKAV